MFKRNILSCGSIISVVLCSMAVQAEEIHPSTDTTKPNAKEEPTISICCPPIVSQDPSFTDKLRQQIYQDWVPTKKLSGLERVDISASIAENGKLYDVKIETSSGDRQLDADCLQAVMGASSACPVETVEGELYKFTVSFDSSTKPGHADCSMSKYLGSHGNIRRRYIGFYRIPLDVLSRYPGLFTEQELLDEKNIGLIKAISHEQRLPSWVTQQLRSMYQGVWIPFFNSSPSASKEEILEIRKNLLFDERRDPGFEKREAGISPASPRQS